jgi:hypothetical protein
VLNARAALASLCLAAAACSAPDPAQATHQPARIEHAALDPLLAPSIAALAGDVRLAYDARGTVQLQIENRLTRATGRVELDAHEGTPVELRIDARLEPPAPDVAGRIQLSYSAGRWLALDHASRTWCSTESGEQLPARALTALFALVPRDLAAPAKWIPQHARARAGEAAEFDGHACASLVWSDAHSSGEWLIAPDGLPRLYVETRVTPGSEVEVHRVVLQRLSSAPASETRAQPLGVPDGCTEATPQAAPAPRAVPAQPALVSLAESFEPLRAAFDAAAGKPRVIATFSATCLNCLRLARSARESILDTHPSSDVAFFAVWVDVLDGDSPGTAREAARYVADPRAQHFHDSQRLFARRLARQVGMPALRDLLGAWGSSVDEQDRVFVRDFVTGPAVAYDWIAFYGPEARWTELEAPPEPASAVVQMSPDTWKGIDPAKFFWGPAMAAELRRLADVYFAR